MSLIEQVARHREETQLAAGSIVIEAIETHFEELPGLLATHVEKSDAGFGRTRNLVYESATETRGVLAYRLSGADFDNMDRVVRNLGAQNRTRLIQTALTAYFKDRT